MEHVKARDVSEAYYLVLRMILEKGDRYYIDEGSFKGSERISLSIAGEIADVNTLIVPDWSPRLDFLPPFSLNACEEYFTNYLLGTQSDNEHYTYGTFIVGGKIDLPPIDLEYYRSGLGTTFNTVEVPNQLQFIVNHLQSYPHNAHCYLTVGYPEQLFGYEIKYASETERWTTPCLRGMHFRINSKNELELGVVYRSWDAYAGFPVNIGGFILLQRTVAELLGKKCGRLEFVGFDMHIYKHNVDYAKKIIGGA